MQEIDSAHARCTATERTESVTAWNSLKRSCNSVSQETNAIKACLMSFRNFMNVMWLQCDCYIDCLYIKNVMARWHRKKLISCSVDVFGKHALLRCADFGKEFEGISAKAATCRPPLWPQTVYIRPNSSESVRIHPYRSYRNPLTISSAGRLRSTEAVIWRVRRTGIVSANSTDLPCLNFEPDDLDISPVIRCLLYFILFYYDPPIPLEMLLFPGLWWEQNAPEPTSSCSALSENAAKGCNGLCSNIKHKSPERQVTWRSGSLQSYFSNVSCVFVIVPLYFYT